MKYVLILFIAVSVFFVVWRRPWTASDGDKLVLDSTSGAAHMVKSNTSEFVSQINQDILDLSNENYEDLLLQLLTDEGFVGEDLYKRMTLLQIWLNDFKVYTVRDLRLDVRRYVDYIELRYQTKSKEIRGIQMLEKRLGEGATFDTELNEFRIKIKNEYHDQLHDIFGDKMIDVLKFNKLFNDKIKKELSEEYIDEPPKIEI